MFQIKKNLKNGFLSFQINQFQKNLKRKKKNTNELRLFGFFSSNIRCAHFHCVCISGKILIFSKWIKSIQKTEHISKIKENGSIIGECCIRKSVWFPYKNGCCLWCLLSLRWNPWQIVVHDFLLMNSGIKNLSPNHWLPLANSSKKSNHLMYVRFIQKEIIKVDKFATNTKNYVIFPLSIQFWLV